MCSKHSEFSLKITSSVFLLIKKLVHIHLHIRHIRRPTRRYSSYPLDHPIRVVISAPIPHTRKSSYPLPKSQNRHIRADMTDMTASYPPATLGTVPVPPQNNTSSKDVTGRF